MPAIIPIALGIGGAVAGGLAGRGRQGSIDENQSSNQFSTQTGTSSGTTMPVEDPLFTSFRQSLLPILGGEISKAQAPVYGPAQKAAYLNSLNDFANASSDSLKGKLAGRGDFNTGALDTGLSTLEQGRQGQAAGFFSQLPFLESQAHAGRVNNLLGLATNFLGRSPLGQTSTESKTAIGTNTSTSAGQKTEQGPSFLSGFFNSLGGMMGAGATGSGPFSGIFKPRGGGFGGGYPDGSDGGMS